MVYLYDFSSADNSVFDDCSCCDGSGCPSGWASCTSDPESFCSNDACAGNPICGDGASPPASTPVAPPVVSPSSQPTINTECGVNNANVIAGQSVSVPPCIDNVDTVYVTVWPVDGSLTVRDDGSVVYIPNAGFQGEDTFTTETCDAEGNCFAATVIMQVTAAAAVQEGEDGGDGGGGGSLAGLAALALIPIVAVGYLVYRKRSGRESNGKKEEAMEVTSASQLGRQEPYLPSHEVATRVPQSSGRQSGGGGYMPTVKDQVQSAVRPQAETSGVTASLDSDSAFQGSSTASRGVQDPPADPPAAATQSVHAVPASQAPDFMPDVKDQCREVIEERRSNDTPLADAIVIDASDVEDPRKA